MTSFIPEGWSEVKLGDVVHWYQKDIPNEQQEGIGIKYYIVANHIDSDDISINRFGAILDGEKGPTITKHFEKGDILLSTRSVALRKAAIAPISGVTGEKILVLRTSPDSALLPNLFPFVVHSTAFWNFAQDSAAGSVNKFTSWTRLREYEFPRPPLEEQKRMAEILWTLEEAIRKKDEVAEAARRYKKVLMKHLFTFGAIRISEIPSTKMKETKSGMVPINWEIKTVSEVADVVGGGTPNTRLKEYWNGEIFWARPSEITKLDGKYIKSTERKITELGLERSNAKMLPLNSLLLTTRATIGFCAINKVEIATNQGFQNLIPKDKMDIEFLYYVFNGAYVQKELLRHARGSTFAEVSNKDIKKLKVPLPPLSEQQKIAELLSKLDRNIEGFEAHKKRLINLKKRLLNDLLSGARRLGVR